MKTGRKKTATSRGSRAAKVMKHAGSSRLRYHCAVGLLASLFARGVRADDADIGRAFLEQGRFGEARTYIQRAYEADSTNAAHRFYRAATLTDAREAERIYRALAATGTVDRTLRSESLIRLGEMHFVAGAYDSALVLFEQAWNLDPSEKCTRTRALSAIRTQDFIRAEALCAPLVSSSDRLVASEAQYFIGVIHHMNGECEKAIRSYESASKPADAPHNAEALTGAYLCAAALNQNREMKHLEQQLGRYEFLLEGPMLDSLTAKDTFAEAGAGMDVSGAQSRYTLQVGAFASKDNAERMWKRLGRQFDDVTIAATESGGRTLYRVRVGAFVSEDDAQRFGRRRLTSKGMSYRIVAK